jgi:hypothetical protein
MPAKRTQTSKQRRAAQNRAAREALVARRESAARRPAEASEEPAPAPARRRWFGAPSEDRRPSRPDRPPSLLERIAPERFALVGLALAVVAAVALLLLPFVEVEGTRRGDTAEYESLLANAGLAAVAFVAVPVTIAALGAWAARPPRRPKLLVGAAIAQVACVIISQAGLFFLFSAALLGLAAWRVRRSPGDQAAEATPAVENRSAE